MSEGVDKRFAPVFEDARDEHPLLEARHVDDLTDAVNAMTRALSRGERLMQTAIEIQHRQLDMQRQTIDVLAEIRDALTSVERPTKRARKK